MFKLCQTHFSRGSKKFSRRGFARLCPPGYGPGHTKCQTGFTAQFGSRFGETGQCYSCKCEESWLYSEFCFLI